MKKHKQHAGAGVAPGATRAPSKPAAHPVILHSGTGTTARKMKAGAVASAKQKPLTTSTAPHSSDKTKASAAGEGLAIQDKTPLTVGLSANWLKLQEELGIGTRKRQAPQNIDSGSTSQPEKRPKIWFDDVDEELLEPDLHPSSDVTVEQKQKKALEKLTKANSDVGLTAAVAMDCEMVGVGYEGAESILARVSIVNQFGQCIYDSFVKPTEEVTDYRTAVSGVRPRDLENAAEFKEVQKAVSDILQGRTLVGHAVHNDLKVLFLDHPRKKIRDTSRYKPFRALFNGRNPSLKKLTAKVLRVDVQEGEHNSVQDAQAAMRLYTMFRARWEKDIKMGGRARLQANSTPDVAEAKVDKEYTSEYTDTREPCTSDSSRKKVVGRRYQ